MAASYSPFPSLRAALWICALAGAFIPVSDALATPANKAALAKHYETFLPPALNRCTTCHLPSEHEAPETLAEFPHNPFGDRLRALGKALAKDDRRPDIGKRLLMAASEDADGDGVDNETEILLGHNPGDAADLPAATALAGAPAKREAFGKMLAAYRWQPFEAVTRPQPPAPGKAGWVRNPVDAFVAREHETRQLTPRPEAAKETLLRRVHLALTGLTPTPEELRAFLADESADSYEKVVEKLLESPQYGERWARHWMDVWRYSDWTGYQNVPRDSKPHIWRWRDWIVESLNADRGYDRMVMEMLAADELAPTDESALRATGYLVRNFKSQSRERWLEDTVGHTFQAFQGLTMNCAKCHDHMYDPISQREYFEVRAIFEPHSIRTDRVPGEVDTGQDGDGLVRVYDAVLAAKTYVLDRGDERKPDKSALIPPNLPRIFQADYQARPVMLPLPAVRPDKRDFVIKEDLAAAERTMAEARALLGKLQRGEKVVMPKPLGGKAAIRAAAAAAKLPPILQPLPAAKTVAEAERNVALAEARLTSYKATLAAEALEGDKKNPEWKRAAKAAVIAARTMAILETQIAAEQTEKDLKIAKAKADKDAKGGDKGVAAKSAAALAAAQKKHDAALAAVTKAAEPLKSPVPTSYPPIKAEVFPATSTGRRLALAQWFASPKNPLTARVAANHIWAHHFGRGLAPTLNDFGRSGQPPSHPQLLDWLAAELMTPSLPSGQPWSMKHIHRLIVTSSTFRMASTPDAANAAGDPNNVYLWRMPSRRMEAEVVRDNVLHVAGNLDLAMGGADIDHELGMTSKRRSLYMRVAPEKEVEFIKIFDGPNPVECYSRPVTVMPHQALALANSELVFSQGRALAQTLLKETENDDRRFITAAYERILSRPPSPQEATLCLDFLKEQAGLLASSAAEVEPAALVPSAKKTAPATEEPASAPAQRARENLIMVLFNHNDFVTIR